ncbi:MAG: hypothetical protein ICV68_13125, partial [Pyrinomonadaceae bacterium]|nr:hypothetical protein [Pyrinomonadaceae bacterium]
MMRRLGLPAAACVCAALIALAACKANDGADTRSHMNDTAASTSSTPAGLTTTPAGAAAAPSPQVDEARRISIAELQQALEK